jgi:hypothetical protein
MYGKHVNQFLHCLQKSKKINQGFKTFGIVVIDDSKFNLDLDNLMKDLCKKT